MVGKSEMDSLMRHGLPVVSIVEWRGHGGLRAASARYDLVMRAFGADGETIVRPAEVAPAVRQAFAAGVPYCLNVKMIAAKKR
jgi:acetolactate synthase-1/2/3 large subunit